MVSDLGPTTVPGAAPEVLDPPVAIHQLKEQHPQDILARWAHAVREVYDHALAYPEPGPNLPETVRRAQRVEQQQRYQQWLWSICKPYLGSDAPMRVLCQRVERFLPELVTFVAEPRAAASFDTGKPMGLRLQSILSQSHLAPL